MQIAAYVPAELGTNALKRLGARIAEGAELEPGERELYETFMRDARERMVGTRLVINTWMPNLRRSLPRLGDVEVVGRVKTLNTLGDKLRRTPDEKLPSIHDIAGLRLVADVSVIEQRVVASVLVNLLNELVSTSREAKLIDRIAAPQNGYRALHVVAWPGGRPIEIQIRTQLQHAWAQLMEIIGDRWGREPRYGLPVRGANDSERTERAEVVETLQVLSRAIADFEDRASPQGVLHIAVADEALEQVGVDLQMVARVRSHAQKTAQEVAAAEAELRRQVDLLRENITL